MAVAISADEATAGAFDGSAGQYLTFKLCGEQYGLEILRVQEIKGWDTCTPIPHTPDYIPGLLNLRGSVVPVVDLRARFNLPAIDRTPTTVVIVVRARSGEQERIVGLVVDAVADVYRIEDEQIQASPDMGMAVRADYVSGLTTIDDRMVILLNIDRMIDLSVLPPVE